MSATISLTGPSTTPGAPQITPAAVNTAVNGALSTNYAAAATATTAEAAARTAADAAIVSSLTGYAPLVGGLVPWANMQATARQLPIMFPIIGKPPSGQVYNRSLGMNYIIPANFSGSVYFGTTSSALNQTFIVNSLISLNPTTVVTVQIGTLTINSGTHSGLTLSSQAAASVSPSTTLQLVAPNPQDASLADLCICIMALRA